MAVDWEPRTVYLLASAAFQGLLTVLILWAPRRTAVRYGLALITAVSLWQTLQAFLGRASAFPQDFAWVGGNMLDPLIALTLLFVLTQIPAPLGGRAGARVLAAAWTAALVVWAVASFALRGDQPALDWGKLYSQTLPFVAGAVLLAVRLVPHWIRLPGGPLRAQTLLVAAALGIGLARIATNNAWALAVEPLEGPLNFPKAVLLALMGFPLAAALLLLVVAGLRSRRWDTVAFVAVLLLGPLVVVVDRTRETGDLGEFATETVRPALLAAAILRFDLFQVPRPVRAVALPAAAVSLGVIVFMVLTALLTSPAEDRSRISTTTSAAALALMVGLALLLARPIRRFFVLAATKPQPGDRLERYRLGLEQLRHLRDPVAEAGEAERLRRSYGVTPEEHNVLVAIMASNVLVPAGRLGGARPGDLVAARYEVIRELGRGGHGRALLARDRESGADVVLKEAVRPWEEGAGDRRAALEREARIGQALRSPRVVRVHGTVSDGYHAYLVRQYVRGETLEDLVRRVGPLSPARTRGIVLDVLEGLAALHEGGLLHLDVKPANVVLDEAGRGILIDFGTTRRLDAPGEGTLTQAEAPVGTLAWMAPEQVLGRRPDRRADVFAAGALLHYLVTARPHVPVDASAYELQDALVRGRYGPGERLAAVPFEAVCAKALERDPAKRYGTAAEMGEALRNLRPGTRASSSRRPPRRRT